MRRRDFIAAAGSALLVGPPLAAAQSTDRVFHIATFTPALPLSAQGPQGATILRVLAQDGYVVGKTLSFDVYATQGDLTRMPQMAQQIAASKVDVVIASGYPAGITMKGTGIPTVMATGAGDPVATHLVDTLAHPGGNITGISDDANELSTKRMELLKEAVPSLRKIAMLWNKNDLAMTMRYQSSANAASALGVTVEAVGVGEPNDFDDAFDMMTKDPPDAILMVSDALTLLNRKRIYAYADQRRIPAIFESDNYVRDGGLMSYGADTTESYERAARLAERIFKGAKPGDLPFERPTKYVFAVNLKTAKAIGLDLSPQFVALADTVIE